jgi:hypothetical protein
VSVSAVPQRPANTLQHMNELDTQYADRHKLLSEVCMISCSSTASRPVLRRRLQPSCGVVAAMEKAARANTRAAQAARYA